MAGEDVATWGDPEVTETESNDSEEEEDIRLNLFIM